MCKENEDIMDSGQYFGVRKALQPLMNSIGMSDRARIKIW